MNANWHAIFQLIFTNQFNSNLLQLLLLNRSTKWADIFRVYLLTLLITIDYSTVEKPYAWIVSFANSNTFSLVDLQPSFLTDFYV